MQARSPWLTIRQKRHPEADGSQCVCSQPRQPRRSQSSVWAVIGATVECIGGILIVTGLKTRYASLLMILFVIVATAISHRYWGFAEAARRTQ